ncbi:hypothetical protein NDN08_002606 [Rhodosorus marinus]|uniref:Oxidation resistance protein 1 n=1 Tax=Rhodosorus marinus TaxID=101924 RepID=A0AAV8UXQ2_9RHOD|nr:hypothetical protein NDN08_002606 [Rhodosorus marinus]
MSANQEDDFWRRKVESLRKEKAELELEVTSSKEKADNLRKELERNRKILEELDLENEKLEVDAENQGSADGEVARLEKELLAGKVGFEQAKFERDSLKAELNALKRSWRSVTKRPLPGRIERVVKTAIESRKEIPVVGEAPVQVDTAVRIKDKYMPGTCYIYSDRVKFEPDFTGVPRADGDEDCEFEISTEGGDFVLGEKIQEVGDTQSQFLTQGMLSPLVIERSNGEPVRFVGFHDPIAAVHSRLLSEMLQSNPLVSLKRGDSSLKLRRKGSLPSTPRSTSRSRQSPLAAGLNVPDNGNVDLGKLESTQELKLEKLKVTRKISDYTPRLSEDSKLLDIEKMLMIYDQVPPRYRNSDLSLVYSTMRDGISLQTFYSRCEKRSPTFVLIKATNDAVFGGFASAPWKVEKSYYGTGECFVFSVIPKFEVFRWTRSNSYFQLSNDVHLAMGGGGHFAFWIDSDFLHGTSDESQTFGNHCLCSSVEFECVSLEAWGFEPPRRS